MLPSVLRLATSHDAIDGDMPHQTLAIGRRQDSNRSVPAVVGVFHELLYSFHGGWYDGHAVTPHHIVIEFIDLINRSAEDRGLRIGSLRMGILINLLLGNRVA